MSIGFWSNERRNCYVQESGIDPDFKQTVYPYLNELDQLQNEIFSSVKELYYKFANDATIRTVSSHVNRNVYNDLTLKFVEEIEAVLPKMTELKQQFITTLQNHVRESGRGLDEEVSFAMGKLHAAKGPIEKRVQDVVVKYNFKASLARKEQADLMIQEYFRKAPLEVPEPEETLKDQPAVEAAPVTMQAVVTRNRQRGETIEFRTDGRAAAEFQPREQAQDQGGADDEIDENISDEKFNDIKSKVKLSNPENLNIEGQCISQTFSLKVLPKSPNSDSPLFYYTCFYNHVHTLDPASNANQTLLDSLKLPSLSMSGIFNLIMFGKQYMVFLADTPVQVFRESESILTLKNRFKYKRAQGCRHPLT